MSLQKYLSSIFTAVINIPVPLPFTWRWKLRNRYHRMCPTVTCLVSSPPCVLDKLCLCRRTTFCVKCLLAPLTNSWLLVQAYSKNSNRSSGHNQLSTVSGVATKAHKTGVVSSWADAAEKPCFGGRRCFLYRENFLGTFVLYFM